MPLVIILGIILVPALALILLKVNAVLVYLTLCLGAVLSQFVSNNSQLNSFVVKSSMVNKYLGGSSNIRLGLVIIPPILTAIFMIRTAKGHKLSINIVTSLAVGLLALFLVVPLLPISISTSISTSSLWNQLSKYEGMIVGLSSVLVLVLLILHRSKMSSGGSHNKYHKGA
ncbi:MAG TPA: hypothetical protein VIH90_06630 [Candidatus Saccharimonadales bacterium]